MATGLICLVGASSRLATLGMGRAIWTAVVTVFCAFAAFRLLVAALLRILFERAGLMGSVNAHSKSCLLEMLMVVSMRLAFMERTGARASATHTALQYNVTV